MSPSRLSRKALSLTLRVCQVRVYETLHPLKGRIDHAATEFVRRIMRDLVGWHAEWRKLHLQRLPEDHVLLHLLDVELYYAQLWAACVALRGCHWEKLAFDQRELAFQAKDAALQCLDVYLGGLRPHLKFAIHEIMVQASFAAVFLLKVAILFPRELSAATISRRVADLAQIMSECAAERYALTLRLMLRSFRRKMGETTMMPGTPRQAAQAPSQDPAAAGGLQTLLSDQDLAFLDDLGPFNWPDTGVSPSALPPWIMDTVSGVPRRGLSDTRR